MTLANCDCRCNSPIRAFIASVIIGVVAAFLQITGVITIAPVFLWVALGIAIVYLAVLILATALANRTDACACLCNILFVLLIGILGTILFALVLLAVGIVAASVVSALLVGLLLFFFTLMITGSASLVSCLSGCGD